jgi:hypothetical protein
MDPFEACRILFSKSFSKRGSELSEIEDDVAGWEVEMRVNDNGRLKLCTYII